MRCPACNAENARDAVQCAACNAPLPRRPARRKGLAPEADTPFGVRTEPSNHAALRAYRISLFGLIPVAGLVLGPAAVVLGVLANLKGRFDPAYNARGPATAAVILGAIDALTNWGGVVMMFFGLLSIYST